MKPFNFLTAFQFNGFLRSVPETEAEIPRGRGRPKGGQCSPVAPFERDPAIAAAKAFDRHTGEPVSADDLKTYAESLQRYHLSCESKFANGEFLDRGVTERRHVIATEVPRIGKEANRVDDGGIGQAAADYGSSGSGVVSSKKSRG